MLNIGKYIIHSADQYFSSLYELMYLCVLNSVAGLEIKNEKTW